MPDAAARHLVRRPLPPPPLVMLAVRRDACVDGRFALPELELNPLPPNTWSRVKYKQRSLSDQPCALPAARHGHTLLLRPAEKALYLFGGQQVARAAAALQTRT